VAEQPSMDNHSRKEAILGGVQETLEEREWGSPEDTN